jgi:protein-disulfide isomerase
VLAVTPEDHVEGSPNAPVTVIEYFSLTCEHCAHFARTTLPAIRKAYIETGKVRWVYRDFPLDGQALQAAVLARCAGGSRYTALVQAMLDAQSGWVGKADYSKALVNIAKLAGVDADTIARCQEDKKAENMVLQMRTDANTQLQLRSTPTFFVNGAELKGAMDTEKFEGMIQGALAQIAPHS